MMLNKKIITLTNKIASRADLNIDNVFNKIKRLFLSTEMLHFEQTTTVKLISDTNM